FLSLWVCTGAKLRRQTWRRSLEKMMNCGRPAHRLGAVGPRGGKERKRMKIKIFAVLLAGLIAAAPPAAQELLPGERETVINGIPDVVAAGARWQIVWADFVTADGIVGTPDGGVIFAQEQT